MSARDGWAVGAAGPVGEGGCSGGAVGGGGCSGGSVDDAMSAADSSAGRILSPSPAVEGGGAVFAAGSVGGGGGSGGAVSGAGGSVLLPCTGPPWGAPVGPPAVAAPGS